MVKRAENKDVARLMFASITRPINAALAGAGTLFAVAGLHNPPLALVGAAMLVGTTWSMGRDLGNGKFVQEVLSDGEEVRALPEIPESLAGQYRLQCLEAKRHLEKTLDAFETGGDMAEELRPLREQIMESVESVYRLAERAHRIDGSLAAQSRNEINKEIEKIKAQLVLTTDTQTRKYLEGTKNQKEEQLKTYDELSLSVRRIQAQMQHINATLDNVQFKVIKISSAGPGGQQADEVTETLQSLLDEVRLFEHSIDKVYEETASLGTPGSGESWDERLQQRNRLPSGQRTDNQALPGRENNITPTPGT